MLLSIRIINWRSHSDSLLEFKKGTNLLIGLMGAGKSSALDAICFALFGTFPALERRKLKLEDLIRLNENELKVVLELEFEGNKYRIERKCSKGKRGSSSDAEIYKNNAMIDKTPTSVTSYVEQLLKIDYDLFTRAIYSEQNNIDYFLTIDPRRRKEEVDVLLGLDKFENARANAVSVINRMKSNRKVLESKFSREKLDAKIKEKNEKEAKEKELEKEIAELRKKLELENAELRKSEEKFFALKKNRQDFDALSKQKIEYENSIAMLKQETSGKEISEELLAQHQKEKAENDERINRITKDISYAEQENTKKTKELATIEARIKTNEKVMLDISINEKHLAALFDGKNDGQLTEEMKECEGKIIDCRSEMQTLTNTIKELTEFDGKDIRGENCPICGSQLTPEKIAHTAKEREVKIEKSRKRLSELRADIENETKTAEKIGKIINEARVINARLESLYSRKEDVGSLKEKSMEMAKQLDEMNNERSRRNKEAALINEANQKLAVLINNLVSLLSKKKKLAEIELALSKLLLRADGLKYSEAEFEEVRKNTEEKKLLNEKLRGNLSTVESQHKYLSELCREMQKEVQQLSLIEEEIRNSMAMEEQMIIYKNVLVETQLNLRTNLIEAINGAMNEIWHIFYPYKDFKALRINVSEKDYDFEAYDSEWKAIESVCSGGERACAALTLRVALAMVLTPNLSWLILDEPTHNLDKDAVELLSQTLQFKVPEVVEQTFVITHEEALMGSEFASSYKLKRDKLNFGATVVEKI